MELDTAIVILKDRVETDRAIREGKAESDFDRWAERQCIAIERVLEEIRTGKSS